MKTFHEWLATKDEKLPSGFHEVEPEDEAGPGKETDVAVADRPRKRRLQKCTHCGQKHSEKSCPACGF